MKRLILAAVLSTAALALSSGRANAGGCRKCNGCGAEFCVRQYNAFSPVCFGSVYCDGINPLGGVPGGFPSACCGPQQPQYPMAMMPQMPQMPWPGEALPPGTPGTAEPPKTLPAPGMFPAPGGQFLPPPGAQAIPSMPRIAPVPVGMGYPWYVPQMNPGIMPAAYPYYGYQPYPQQMMPMQGYAPQGYPQQGYAPQGYAPQQ